MSKSACSLLLFKSRPQPALRKPDSMDPTPKSWHSSAFMAPCLLTSRLVMRKRQSKQTSMDIHLETVTRPQEEPRTALREVSQKVAVVSWEVTAPWTSLPLRPLSGAGRGGGDSETDDPDPGRPRRVCVSVFIKKV